MTGTAETRARILEATVRRLLAGGAARLSMQDVADEAAVSKGLIHYHFSDKETLLARTVEWLVAGMVERERVAAAELRTPAAVDALWAWLERELALGHARALLALALDPAEPVRVATRAAARTRRESAVRTIEALFAALELSPRIPVAMLADVS